MHRILRAQPLYRERGRLVRWLATDTSDKGVQVEIRGSGLTLTCTRYGRTYCRRGLAAGKPGGRDVRAAGKERAWLRRDWSK
jgi:hypothetical protein